jgi:AcrR family transcriptional regulator
MAHRATGVPPINTALQKGRKSTQRERLLAGVITAANRDGYAHANVSAVIAEAGVSRPTFYEYFVDKDDCFLAALSDVQERLLDEVRAAVSNATPEQATDAAVAALVGFASAQPAMARFLMNESMAGGPRALNPRDQGIAEITKMIEQAQERAGSDIVTPDLPTPLLIGGTYRLLASRLRRGVPGLSGLLEELLMWTKSYERPAGEQRWRTLAAVAPPPPSPFAPEHRMRAPAALPPGRPRLSEEEVAENHRQRLFFAAARLAGEHGYTATTIADITERAGVDRRAFYALFKDKRDIFMAVHEWGFQQLLAVTAGAFFAGGSWPERVWEGGRGLTQFLQNNPTIAHVGFVEAYAVGPGAVQRVDDSVIAFSIFLQEGYQYRPRSNPPSRLALEAIVMAIYEMIYQQARGGRRPEVRGLLPLLAYICLAPFIGVAEADAFIEGKLNALG